MDRALARLIIAEYNRALAADPVAQHVPISPVTGGPLMGHEVAAARDFLEALERDGEQPRGRRKNPLNARAEALAWRLALMDYALDHAALLACQHVSRRTGQPVSFDTVRRNLSLNKLEQRRAARAARLGK
jgi:hypothetical protein